jgi:hypothetical protein
MADGDDGKEVLGSLPRHRPGIESPRRAEARATTETASRPSPEPTAAASSRSELAQLEQLARGGARLAAGAAATGLKLAGRTVGGLGRVVGRL